MPSIATFLKVYPPPPKNNVGLLNFFMNYAAYPWPFTDKLKHPRWSPESESAPPCNKIA